MGQVSPEQFIANLWTVCTIWVMAALVLSIIAGVWGLARYRRWRRQQQGLAREQYETTHDAQGRLMPPVGRGICQGCGAAPPLVYYLDDGRHLCPDWPGPRGAPVRLQPPAPGMGVR